MNKKAPTTLAQKLKAQFRERPVGALRDIEDIAAQGTSTASVFFSPLQTRGQRVKNLNPVRKLDLAETKPKRKVPLAKEPEKTTTIEQQASGAEAEIPKNEKPIGKTGKAGKKRSIPRTTTTAAQEEDNVEPESPPAKSPEVKNWQPKNWRPMLDNIRKMRAEMPAPVDTMGCHKCSDEEADEKTQRFQKLVALMLSSQTKDETTFEAMQRLKDHGLTPQAVLNMKTIVLEDLLRPVSFYKNKAKNLQKVAQILIEKFDGDIPRNIDDIVALPGVGPKMAHICMSTAWNETTGIGVDVHVHRIANRMQWLPKETKTPEQTRAALEEWLPRELWKEVNGLLVGFGQTVCKATRPLCGDCLNCHICPSAEIPPKKSPAKKHLAFETEQGQDHDDLKQSNSSPPVKKPKATKKKKAGK